MTRRTLALALLLVLLAGPASAFVLVVWDPVHTAKSAAIAVIKSLSLETAGSNYRYMRRWARTLSLFENLGQFVATEVPKWRTWRQYDPMPESFLFMNALNAGVGAAGPALTAGRLAPDPEAPLTPALARGLATLDLQDSTWLEGMDMTGRIRGDRHAEFDALQDLDADVAATHSTSARLDVIAVGNMLRTRQQTTRIQLTQALVEQLTVESIRARETEAAALAMRTAQLTPAPSLVDDAADDLRGWRQP